jgi:hypothetical protein
VRRVDADEARAKATTLNGRRIIPAAGVAIPAAGVAIPTASGAIPRHRGITRGTRGDTARLTRCVSPGCREIRRGVAATRAAGRVIAEVGRCNQKGADDHGRAR